MRERLVFLVDSKVVPWYRALSAAVRGRAFVQFVALPAEVDRERFTRVVEDDEEERPFDRVPIASIESFDASTARRHLN